MTKRLLLFLMLGFSPLAFAKQIQLPHDFVYVKQIIPNIKIDLRYYGNYNFIGHRINGYNKPKCILTKEAAYALLKVQNDLNKHGLGLLIYDSYRPQKAVDEFVSWAKDLSDTKMKKYFYSHEEKRNLFKDGYIAAKSTHTRGSTVDLTIICLNNCQHHNNQPLNMGSSFDAFAKISWPSYQNISPEARANRLLLRTVMEKYGFEPITTEWWHFTLKHEPYPNTYFNFDIE